MAKVAVVRAGINDRRQAAVGRRARRLAVGTLTAMLPVVGCGPEVIVDDFGVAGYARIRGTVTRANGARFANASVFIRCGPTAPDYYGRSAPTDAAGQFDTNFEPPGAGTLPASGEMVCRVDAPGDAPPFASAQAAIPFSRTPNDRPTTVIDVTEGATSQASLPGPGGGR